MIKKAWFLLQMFYPIFVSISFTSFVLRFVTRGNQNFSIKFMEIVFKDWGGQELFGKDSWLNVEKQQYIHESYNPIYDIFVSNISRQDNNELGAMLACPKGKDEHGNKWFHMQQQRWYGLMQGCSCPDQQSKSMDHNSKLYPRACTQPELINLNCINIEPHDERELTSFMGRKICKRQYPDNISNFTLTDANGDCHEGYRACGDKRDNNYFKRIYCIPNDWRCPITDIKLVPTTAEIN